jgi:hypothetical protein
LLTSIEKLVEKDLYISVIILYMIIAKAKMPSGWDLNELIKSAWYINEIDFPIPQPGQKSKPKLLNGQSVKCET